MHHPCVIWVYLVYHFLACHQKCTYATFSENTWHLLKLCFFSAFPCQILAIEVEDSDVQRKSVTGRWQDRTDFAGRSRQTNCATLGPVGWLVGILVGGTLWRVSWGTWLVGRYIGGRLLCREFSWSGAVLVLRTCRHGFPQGDYCFCTLIFGFPQGDRWNGKSLFHTFAWFCTRIFGDNTTSEAAFHGQCLSFLKSISVFVSEQNIPKKNYLILTVLLYYTFFVVVMDCTQTLKFRRHFWRSESELEPLSGALPSPDGCRHLSRLFGEPERGLCFGDQKRQIPPGNLPIQRAGRRRPEPARESASRGKRCSCSSRLAGSWCKRCQTGGHHNLNSFMMDCSGFEQWASELHWGGRGKTKQEREEVYWQGCITCHLIRLLSPKSL